MDGELQATEPTEQQTTPETNEVDLDTALAEVFERVNNPEEASEEKPEEEVKTEEPDEKTDKKEEDQPEEVEESDEEKPEEETAKPVIAPPATWSPEMQASWKDIPVEAQQQIVQREQHTNNLLSEMGRKIKATEPLQGVLQTHAETFQKAGVSYEQGIAQLLAANDLLVQDPRQGIQQIARMFNIDLTDYALEGIGEEPPATDPRVDELQQRINQLEAERQAEYQYQEEQGQSQMLNIIDDFAKDKPEFDSLSNEVMANVTLLQQTQPTLGPREMLERAWDAALWQNPSTRQQLLEQEAKSRAERAAKEAQKAKKAATLNVATDNKSEPTTMDIDDLLSQTYDKIQRRG